ncbi:MAG: hypothetical protein WBR17_30600, partial [Paraburkholderia sp.]|uniref:hypothetical protein n=1 Tax=Paraburkholderia sp. TaxID=1926495 RepID=UPI003C5FE5B7
GGSLIIAPGGAHRLADGLTSAIAGRHGAADARQSPHAAALATSAYYSLINSNRSTFALSTSTVHMPCCPPG